LLANDRKDPAPMTTTPTSLPTSVSELQRRRRRETARSAVVVLVLGALTLAVLYAWIYRQQAADRSAAAIAMPTMHMNRMDVFWSFPLLQAAGLAALIWAYIGVALGLMESGGAARWSWLPLTPVQRLRLHRHISLLVLGLILVHVFATAVDAMGDNLLTVLIPGQAGWAQARFAYDIGIIALYLAVLVGPTYYIRRRIGPTRWRLIHRLAIVVYVLSVWHALLLGADIAFYGWVRPFMWLMQIPLLLLFVRRVLEAARVSRASHAARARDAVRSVDGASTVGGGASIAIRAVCYGLAAAGMAAIAGVILVVITGSSDFVTSLQF
jgi:DMSO/TMAO reductase YedYZ heme-binding membrane subunit